MWPIERRWWSSCLRRLPRECGILEGRLYSCSSPLVCGGEELVLFSGIVNMDDEKIIILRPERIVPFSERTQAEREAIWNYQLPEEDVEMLRKLGLEE